MSQQIYAARLPGRPEVPLVEFATSEQIGVVLTALEDNGGTPILEYKLYIDDGDQDQENWSLIESYSGIRLQFTVDKSLEADLLTTGTIYRIRVTAVNVLGEGPPSNNLRVALANPASKPP